MKKYSVYDVELQPHDGPQPDASDNWQLVYLAPEADARIEQLEKALKSCRFALLKQREAMRAWTDTSESAIVEATKALHPTT